MSNKTAFFGKIFLFNIRMVTKIRGRGATVGVGPRIDLVPRGVVEGGGGGRRGLGWYCTSDRAREARSAGRSEPMYRVQRVLHKLTYCFAHQNAKKPFQKNKKKEM